MRRRFTTAGVLGAVFALVLGVMPVFGAVDNVTAVSEPAPISGRSELAFAGSAVPKIDVPAPVTVVNEMYTDNLFIKVFDEQQDVTLGASLAYDQLQTLVDGGTIPAGTVVDSHYVHFDNVGTSIGKRGVGEITFECPMIGLITQDANLAASDIALGAAGTAYPAALVNRGLEQGTGGVGDFPARNWAQQDITGVSTDGLTLFIDLQVFNVLDQLRVITEGQCGTVPVDIDIKPGSFPNSMNIDGHGVIPVAILGSDVFDVAQIDVGTLVFGGLGVRVKNNGTVQCSFEDVNGDYTMPLPGLEGAPDGYVDLVCQFVDDEAYTWTPENGTASVTGFLLDGTPFAGSDSINFIE